MWQGKLSDSFKKSEAWAEIVRTVGVWPKTIRTVAQKLSELVET